jgi:precorrin-2 dehydrogenase/sirohydrochlorin ferrochelatase
MAALVRRWIARNLPGNVGGAVERVGLLRSKLREIAPAAEDGQKRMRWISKVCDKWTLEELCEMTETDMDVLLRSYQKGEVPSLQIVRGDDSDEGIVEFDGSFGWWI